MLPLNGYIILANDTTDTTEGSLISFVCLTSHSETATVYTTVCNQEGDWEPHPVNICQLGNNYLHNNTLNCCFLYPTKFMATANKAMLDVVTLVVISSLSVFILTAILFFLFGYIYGCR